MRDGMSDEEIYEGEIDGGKEEQEAPRIAGFTEEQIQSLLAKASRVDELEHRLDARIEKAFGKFGEIQQKLEAVTEATRKQQEPQTFFPEEALKEIEDYDINLANVLKKLPAVNHEEKGWATEGRVKELDDSLDDRIFANVQAGIMDYARESWRKEKESDEWAAFLATLPEAEKAKAVTTSQASEYLKYFAKFDEWKVKKRGRNNDRVEANLMPKTQRGTQSDELSADDEMKWYNYT